MLFHAVLLKVGGSLSDTPGVGAPFSPNYAGISVEFGCFSPTSFCALLVTAVALLAQGLPVGPLPEQCGVLGGA
mgnify:FL=1